MIELIFALVIMGIALMSAPMLIRTSTQSAYTAIQQEAITAAASQMGMVLSSEWDEADTDNAVGEPILRTQKRTYNECNGTRKYPPGVSSSSGRYCLGKDLSFGHTASTTFGMDTNDTFKDDVDDYDGDSATVGVYNSETILTEKGDYVDRTMTVATNVYYGDDTLGISGSTGRTFDNPFQTTLPTSNSSSIKLVTIKLTTGSGVSELTKEIRLSAFTCNIGARRKVISNELDL